MKKAPVVIKGNKSGIRIVLDDALPFPEILEEVEKKFKESSDFLGEAQVAVSFDGSFRIHRTVPVVRLPNVF